MNDPAIPWWARESAWRKLAIWVTAIMAVALIVLTFDTLQQITVGKKRVPAYDVINRRIYFRHDAARDKLVPVIGSEAPLFGRKLSAAEAEALVTRGKLTFQSRNCINCHTILGNGAYYAPDLTKAWLDPSWAAEAVREELMLSFLQDPAANARGFGSGRRMPHLGIDADDARGVIAFLKWTAAIDTNGFPARFTPIAQEGDE
jgi:nitric oxide reductase subunit C